MPARYALLGHGAILLTVLVWGSLIPLIDVLLGLFDPFSLSALRYTAATAALAALVLARRDRVALHVLPLRKVLLLGAIGIAGFTTLYTLGIRFSDPSTAVIVNSAAPIVSAVVARLVYRTPIERGIVPALALVAAGSLVAALGRPRIAGFGLRGGELLLVVAGFCWAWYSINAQKWLGHLRQRELTLATMMSGCLVLILVFVIAAALGAGRWPATVPSGVLGLLAYVAFGGTLVGVMSWNFAVARLGIVVASLYLSLIPVIGMATAAILGKPPSPLQLGGGALVMSGILQLQLRRWRRRGSASR
jgi:drug/metabolite transporter (DMT)-like permease